MGFVRRNNHRALRSTLAAQHPGRSARLHRPRPLPPGVTTRLNRLKGIVERYAILSGSGRVEVGGQAPREVAAGDTVTIPAMHSQRIANSGQADLVFLAVCTPRFTKDTYEDLESGQARYSTGFT
ncbi:MAG: cupin domain-containing protein [Sulfurimicrobium sp.]|nr:cupin domain-containing protein [Sulfurimicrobium sp.]